MVGLGMGVIIRRSYFRAYFRVGDEHDGRSNEERARSDGDDGVKEKAYRR